MFEDGYRNHEFRRIMSRYWPLRCCERPLLAVFELRLAVELPGFSSAMGD